MDYKGKIVVLGIKAGIAISDQHEQAVRDVVAKYPDMEIVAFEYANISRSQGKELMEAWLQAYPEIDGVQAWESTSLQGAIEAAKEAGRYNEIKAWAGKSEQGYLQLVKEGLNGCGYWAYADGSIDSFHALIKILRGEPVHRHWRLPVIVIEPEKIDDFVVVDAPATWFPSRIPNDEIQEWLDKAATK
jgi:ribose transport system substrate-binding protein